MKSSRVDTVRCGVRKGALWRVADQALYFVDIYVRRKAFCQPTDGTTRSREMPDDVGAPALRERAGAVLGMRNSLYTLDCGSGAIEKIAGPVFDDARVVINDGRIDADDVSME